MKNRYTFKKQNYLPVLQFSKLHFLLKLVLNNFCYPELGNRAGSRNRSRSRLDRLHNTAHIQHSHYSVTLHCHTTLSHYTRTQHSHHLHRYMQQSHNTCKTLAKHLHRYTQHLHNTCTTLAQHSHNTRTTLAQHSHNTHTTRTQHAHNTIVGHC